MNARIAKKLARTWDRFRYSGAQLERAERVLSRSWRREDLARDVNRYYESTVGTVDGRNEVYLARVCTVCRHLECPCCGGWCDDLDCLDRDHDKCSYTLPAKTDPVRIEAKKASYRLSGKAED